ncbi:hypothetical protein AB1Y20_000571 [Prymnesium parvum]|uniref:Pre-mRNA-splicing factor SLU7 n=1 Tax=Prymnesium parvum TaxID=97485 RepID=A0AB34KAS6_PRYPA
MNQQNSAIWLEMMKRERRAKEKWQGKYMPPEELQALRKEEQAEALALKENARFPNRMPHGRLSERDASELRLKGLDGECELEEEALRPVSRYEAARRKIAEEVAATRPRSHRITGDLSTETMLRDIGPGLWTSVNPAYNSYRNNCSTSHSTHTYDTKLGFGEKVDKTHHMRLEPMMAHADKCLQLGELPFVSGGMKLKNGH